MFVYVIVNKIDLKIYVGKTIKDDLEKYLKGKFWDARNQRNGSSYLYNAIRKHGEENFSIHALFVGLTNEEICEHEKLLIKALKSQHPDVGYNICRGGEGFTGPHTEEWTRKHIEFMKEFYANPEERKKQSEKMKAVVKQRGSAFNPFSEEWKRKQSMRVKKEHALRRGTEEYKERQRSASLARWANMTAQERFLSLQKSNATRKRNVSNR